VRGHVALAQELAGWVRADERFSVVAPHPLSLVCFRLRGDDAANEELLARLNASGRLYLTHTRVRGEYALRLAIGATSTERRHVAAAWEEISRTAGEVLAERAAR